MLYSMSEDPNPQDIIISKLLPFPNKSKVIDAIQYDNPKVRSFALMATTKNFNDLKNTAIIELLFNALPFSKKSIRAGITLAIPKEKIILQRLQNHCVTFQAIAMIILY